MQSTEEKLKTCGLTRNGAKVYLELLKHDLINGSQLAKKSGLDRTLTYQILNNLIEKGLVHYIIKSHKKYFGANDPKNLLNPLKEKEAFIKDFIPELRSLEKIKEEEQEINIYEGIEGLRSLMREIIKEKSFCAFGATGRAYDVLYELPRIGKELTKKGFGARIIMNTEYKTQEILKLKSVEARFLDIKSEATTTIFGDKVSIHVIKERPIIIMIKDKDIVESYKNHFEVLWKVAKGK
ncbi:MAG: helix-turn-helix domain-containing protein [Nanoarchaeota archaeon]|nr:helix-turn-helix domain-containing protein [Nanoarchaeota archaeon]